MNLVFLSCLDLWSGGTRPAGAPSFQRTIDAYLQAGHTVYLITTRFDSVNYVKDGLHVIPVLKQARYLKVQKILNTVFFPLVALIKVVNLSRQAQIDLIYGYEINGIIAGYLLKMIYKKPCVSRFQGTVLYPIIQNGTFWKKFKKLDHFLAFKLTTDLAIMTNDGTFGDKVLQELNPSLARKSIFWRNGVNRPPDVPLKDTKDVRQALNFNEDTLVLMTLSRLVLWKRVDRAITALPLVLAKAKNVVLIIVGDGPEKHSLEFLVKQLQVEKHVIFVDAVEHTRVYDYLKVADIFLSLYDLSNVGNPLLEAMICGKPIVTIRNGDTASVIDHEVTGILVNHGSKEVVAQAIIDLILHPAKRLALAQNARRYAQENFWSWDTRMQHELDTVLELTKNPYAPD